MAKFIQNKRFNDLEQETHLSNISKPEEASQRLALKLEYNCLSMSKAEFIINQK